MTSITLSRDTLSDLVAMGKSDAEIANMVGVRWTTIKELRLKHRILRNVAGRTTEQRREQVMEMRIQGRKAREIAKALGISETVILNDFRCLGLSGAVAYEYTPDQDARLLALRKAGKSIPQIAREIGRTPDSIRARIERLSSLTPMRDVRELPIRPPQGKVFCEQCQTLRTSAKPCTWAICGMRRTA